MYVVLHWFVSCVIKELKILTYEIKNKTPLSFLNRAVITLVGQPTNTYPVRQQQQQQYPGAKHLAASHIVDMPWPKLRFTLWLEGLKRIYQVGDLVTMALVPVIPNAVPMVWKITYINELHKDCKYDTDIQEPICLSVQYPNGVTNQKCPATLRKLTKEELALVDLSNKKPAGSA